MSTRKADQPALRHIRQKTLDELEGVVSGPPPNDSHLVRTCHRLRTKRLDDFEIEDLRIMIGQNIGLPCLIPLALERLEHNPWAAGDMYPGDLLAVTAKAAFAWHTTPDLLGRFRNVLNRALAEIADMSHVDDDGMPSLDVPSVELAAKLAIDLRAALTYLR